MAERSSAIFWVLCPKQSLHCYTCLGAPLHSYSLPIEELALRRFAPQR
ncbi:MAG: hypothetical protein IM597_22240 [Pseudanabaena sp. M176S2SP2A07QC]|nr:hypothetical protein [Pseudanabaena sp. M051S1SP2A07QC]MCA6527814.1 hypothetical protein [Pseudanabaena sp. M179S2SP2A07QC]MCA6536788.1 hypothetical protein [Pseudanabaena sp. M176S2SP2A07QC]MCA6541197.1 hypothetical protein [Pseudanabaena sp. M037S2SP2A07QC]MCA6544503.1 hypothetical protein [Pseudanabaena sp. M074S1SP2A07QC]MCA6567173.1 hypothetical protein [Pseudanabaena sp. M151S2SP2A07QC]MCA6571282.1 hypothetical protein [Pseudanabaena sp. M065S1SP2A07QC]MCA6577310.1 hypothetical prot